MCGCSGTKRVTSKPKSALASSGTFAQPLESVKSNEPATEMVKVEYMGTEVGTFTINSRVDRTVSYRFGNNPGHKVRDVFRGDAERLVGLTDANNRPLYILLSSASAAERDMSAFLGVPVAG